jgi:hypothetical protein
VALDFLDKVRARATQEIDFAVFIGGRLPPALVDRLAEKLHERLQKRAASLRGGGSSRFANEQIYSSQERS